MKKYTINLFILISLLFASCQTNREIKIVVMHTTDLHGAYFPYDFINDKKSDGSLAQICTIVEKERKENKNLILLDNGDILQGQPSAYYYNFIDTTKPHLAARMINYMKYDAATVGNHDIETGHNVYDKYFALYKCPVLAANAVRTDNGQPYFKPYAIIKRDGIKVAVLGMITPQIPKWLPKKFWSEMEFKDMIETAKFWMKKIKKEEKPDITIGLFHSGYNYKSDGENENTPCNENASTLVAKLVPGFDAILIGHQHTKYSEIIYNIENKPVFVIDAQSEGRCVSKLTFTIKQRSNKITEKKVEGKLIESEQYAPDSMFMKKFEDDFNAVKKFVSQPIGRFTQSISIEDAFFGASKFIDLIQKVQLKITKADISFSAPLSMNANINKGTVYVRDMFKLYKYENMLYAMTLSGKEIKNYLEYSYSLWCNTIKNPNENALLMDDENNDRNGYLKNPYYNFDSAAGIVYTVDITKPVGKKINIISMYNGKKFDENKKYTVAINSYRANGGGGHLTEGAKISKSEIENRITFATDKDLRYYLMNYIKDKKEITPNYILNSNEWKFIPTNIADNALKNDRKILFPDLK